jgi:cell division protein FtsQ
VQRLEVDTTQSVWQPLDSLSSRVAGHPMIANVLVERDLPGTLRVIVTERIPVALVPSRGQQLRPADASGTVLPIDPATTGLDLPIASTADSVLLTVLDGLRQNAPGNLCACRGSATRRRERAAIRAHGEVAVGAAGPAMSSMIIVRTSPDVTVARFKDILPVEADLARNHLRAVELDLRFRDQVIARQP